MNTLLPQTTVYSASLFEALPLTLAIRHGDVMTPNGLKRLDVGVQHGKIVFLGQMEALPDTVTVIDATGLTVLPGCMDTQVHFREPGLDYKEDLESGTRSAVMGGITGVFEMPNTNPSTTTQAALEDKLQRCEGRAWSNYAFYMGAAAENIKYLPELELLPGVCGVKLFMGASTGNLLVEDDATIRDVLAHGRRRVAIHAEDNQRLSERKKTVVDTHPNPTAHLHPVWRDSTSALQATQRVIRLAKEVQRPLHVLHITTRDEIQFLADHKDIATVEVLPQHLTLHAPDCYDALGSLAQMNPPIREKHHQDGLWWGIEQGIVDVLGSDHAPHTLEEKQRPYPQSPAGLTGVQTLLPLMLNHVNQGRLTLTRLVDLLCYGPARVFNLRNKGRIALGFDADFTVVDLNRSVVIDPAWIQSKVGWSPFVGKQVQGWPTHTVVGGTVVMQEGQLISKPVGQPFTFWDTL
jgi:dihydroorotase